MRRSFITNKILVLLSQLRFFVSGGIIASLTQPIELLWPCMNMFAVISFNDLDLIASDLFLCSKIPIILPTRSSSWLCLFHLIWCDHIHSPNICQSYLAWMLQLIALLEKNNSSSTRATDWQSGKQRKKTAHSFLTRLIILISRF